eukprot:CAMPEP_0183508500 /NCGR_PEP_ID=MMETSP0371-20130417/8897_1 /TAXON_ID=268820 /ORGANISM="Peridinium aciculiferum, Strain PAER-2" /LENGTH=360 /DNA_ID=CAMNT_0025704881 /DNA_START=109 /DNA_END=1189 /DNA_ORIENTATION=-
MGAAKDRVLQLLCLVALVWAVVVGRDLRKEVLSRQLRNPEKYPQFSDFWTALGSFVGMLIAQLLFRPVFSAVARAMIPKKARWSYPVWGAKVERCCDSVFKCCYYAAMTVWCFSILQGQPWMPWVLGGSGSTRFCWTDGYPFQQNSPELRRFYLTAVGFHLSEVAFLLLEVRKPDFWEMMLHHTVSCTLVGYSYLLNYVRLGSLVLLLHGATDVFIYFSKVMVDTPHTRLIVWSYFGLIAAYAWFRIYVFPVFIMRSAWIEGVQETGGEVYGWGYLNFALCVLLLLHMYWFGLIIKIGFHFRATGQARDLQSNLSSMDMQETKKDFERQALGVGGGGEQQPPLPDRRMLPPLQDKLVYAP